MTRISLTSGLPTRRVIDCPFQSSQTVPDVEEVSSACALPRFSWALPMMARSHVGPPRRIEPVIAVTIRLAVGYMKTRPDPTRGLPTGGGAEGRVAKLTDPTRPYG